MQPTFLRTTMLSAITILAATSLAHAAPKPYTIDPSHTNVTWSLSHFEFSNPNGKFFAPKGIIVLDEEKPDNSTVKVSFTLDNLTSGVTELDAHLKGKDFFNIAQFPTAEFVSTKVELTGKDTANVTGNLTLHGVTKPVTLAVKLNKIGENIFKKHTAGFSATGTLKRSDFGITMYLPGLGDDVSLNIQAEANAESK